MTTEAAQDWLQKAMAWDIDSPQQYLLADAFNKDLFAAQQACEPGQALVMIEALRVMGSKLATYRLSYRR